MDHAEDVSRRSVLKVLAAGGLGAAMPSPARAAAGDFRPAFRRYLESLARSDGGYAWEDQETSHLTPTWAVIGCYRLLNLMPPRKARLAEFVRTHHPGRLKKLEQDKRVFEHQQVQSLVWLEEDPSEFIPVVRAWTRPLAYLKQYEKHGYPVFQSECCAFTCRTLLGMPLDDLSPHFTGYLEVRRRANGSFNNTPASDGGDGHVLNTWWGLQALQTLGRAGEGSEPAAAWLRSCQLKNGGFTYQPEPEFGGVDDAAYTRAAVRALGLLGSSPADRPACVSYLQSLLNSDGGFGDRPGWLSNPVASYYALDALAALGAMDALSGRPGRARPLPRPLPAGLEVFSIQLEAHGSGSPAEAVDLARCLRIHLWGAKNAKPGWTARAQAIAGQQKAQVTFFRSGEEYGTWMNVPGLGTYSHLSDVIAPAGADIGLPCTGRDDASWPVFRERRLAPLEKAGGRLLWQFGENEELVRILLDDSLQRGGYAAISTFHFGNPDFANSEPFLNRWRGRIPCVALQDAHGSEAWWSAGITAGFRTLFLAAEPTWEGWLSALKENWVVAVRHDAASRHQTWMHGGSEPVLDFVREREQAWRWWDNPGISRPLVSVVAIRPDDQFEAHVPADGVNLRVRCAWETTVHGVLKKPLVELKRLLVDGVEVEPALKLTRAAQGDALLDQCHCFHLSHPAPGRHTAAAIIRTVDTALEQTRTMEFFL